MKTSKYFILIFFAIIFSACSSDDTETPTEATPTLTQFVYKNYNVANTPNTIVSSITYTVENNKIVSALFEAPESGFTKNRSYTYSNDRISNTTDFIDGTLNETKSFNYDPDGNLIEYSREAVDLSNAQVYYFKTNFIHTQDTVYGTHSESSDGINYTITSNSKTLLDANFNKTFSEVYDSINDETTRTEMTYDSNNNVISSIGYLKLDDGTFVSTISSSYSYASGLNTLGLVYDATFSRQVLMLSNQHVDNSSALNYFNAKYVTFNTFESYTSTFFGNINFQPEFTNIYNSDNFSTLNDYKMNIDGNPFSRFTYEYTFE